LPLIPFGFQFLQNETATKDPTKDHLLSCLKKFDTNFCRIRGFSIRLIYTLNLIYFRSIFGGEFKKKIKKKLLLFSFTEGKDIKRTARDCLQRTRGNPKMLRKHLFRIGNRCQKELCKRKAWSDRNIYSFNFGPSIGCHSGF